MDSTDARVLFVGDDSLGDGLAAASDMDAAVVADAAAARSWLESNAAECLVVADVPAPERLLDAARAAEPELPAVVVTDEELDEPAPVTALPTDDADRLVDRVSAIVRDRRERRESAAVAHLDDVRERIAEAAAESADQLLETLCSSLTDFDGYAFAWYGRTALQSGALEAVAWDGPSAVTGGELGTDGVGTGWGPDGRAALTADTDVVHDIGGNDSFLPWLDDPPGAVGVCAVAAVPITDGGSGVPFGQLAVYAAHPFAFADRERAALEALAVAVADRLADFEAERWRVGDGVGDGHLPEVVAALPDLAVVHDEDGRFVDVLTPHQIRNYATPADLVGRHVEDVLPPDAAASVLDAVESALETDSVARVEYPIEVGNEPLWYEAKAAPTELSDGRRVAVLTVRETTERKATERELARQTERAEHLASILSHDLGNHLTKASGWVDLARDAVDGDVEELDRVEGVLSEMETLLDRTVTMIRGSHGDLDAEPVDLGSIAERCWTNMPERGTLRVDPGLTPIVADPDRLTPLVENLLVNAVEHAGPEATVRIGAADAGFYVADDGPGIDPDERESVFEFGHSGADSGTGFGLAIVHSIAEAHGWSISVTDSEDGGARFEFEGVEWATVDDAT